MPIADDHLPDEVRELTSLLRGGTDYIWPRLRQLFQEKGLDPDAVWLVECFRDDHAFEYGMVVTPDCRTYQFGYDFLRVPLGGGVLTEWNDRTARAAHLGANENVKQVMRLLGAHE